MPTKTKHLSVMLSDAWLNKSEGGFCCHDDPTCIIVFRLHHKKRYITVYSFVYFVFVLCLLRGFNISSYIGYNYVSTAIYIVTLVDMNLKKLVARAKPCQKREKQTSPTRCRRKKLALSMIKSNRILPNNQRYFKLILDF